MNIPSPEFFLDLEVANKIILADLQKFTRQYDDNRLDLAHKTIQQLILEDVLEPHRTEIPQSVCADLNRYAKSLCLSIYMQTGRDFLQIEGANPRRHDNITVIHYQEE